MSRRRAGATGVSLFPFLAVLMCAMGALILLLLVMSRRIRQQAELRARFEQQSAQLAAVVAPPPPVVSLPAPVPPSPQPRRVIIRRAPAPPAPPPIVTDPTYEQRCAAQAAAHRQAQYDLDRRQQSEVEQLTAEQSRLQTDFASQESRLREEQLRLSRWEERVRETPSPASPPAETDSSAAELQQLAMQRTAVRTQIDTVARQLQAAQLRRASGAAERYTIVPFDAISGTNRRPIVIECRGDALVFAAEEIALPPQDLDGFIPHYNPLSAGVKVLYDGWSARDGGAPPYVLLIVRPQGTIAFYVARTLLQPLDIPFGYELVGDDRQFTWTPTDAALVRECRRAIDETLQERPRVTQLAQTSGRFEPPMKVVGSGGGFRLEEVDRLQQPGRTVQFGEQRVDREQHTFGGGGAVQAVERRGLGIFRKPGASEPRATEAAAASTAARRTAEATPAPRNPAPPPPVPPPGSLRNAAGSAGAARGADATPGVGSQNQRLDTKSWRPSLGSGVSIVRELPVEITGHSLRVCGGEPLAISTQTSADDLARHIAEVLDAEFTTWGRPPNGFAWKPRIKFVVTADGAPISRSLTPIIEGWGFDSTLDYASRLHQSVSTPTGSRDAARDASARPAAR